MTTLGSLLETAPESHTKYTKFFISFPPKCKFSSQQLKPMIEQKFSEYAEEIKLVEVFSNKKKNCQCARIVMKLKPNLSTEEFCNQKYDFPNFYVHINVDKKTQGVVTKEEIAVERIGGDVLEYGFWSADDTLTVKHSMQANFRLVFIAVKSEIHIEFDQAEDELGALDMEPLSNGFNLFELMQWGAQHAPGASVSYLMKFRISNIANCWVDEETRSLILERKYSSPTLYKTITQLGGYEDTYQLPDFTKQLAKSEVFRLQMKEDSAKTFKRLESLFADFKLKKKLAKLPTKLRIVKNLGSPTEPRTKLPFELEYALQRAISLGLIKEELCAPNFYKLLLIAHGQGRAIPFLADFVPQQDIMYDPFKYLVDYMKEEREILTASPPKIENYCTVPKITITPSGMFIEDQETELSNRAVREMIRRGVPENHFARVTFENDGGLSLSGSGEISMQKVFKYFKSEYLDKGILIGDRRFEFLGFSNSQLRTHQCWFFAKYNKIDAEYIRSTLGVFHDKVIAKYAARLGQAFSTTFESFQVDSSLCIPDVERNGFVFSDGVGLIDPDLAKKIETKFNKKFCALQIRFGGCKGMLTVSLNRLPQQIQFRKSMEKFTSKHRVLEICRFSGYSPAFLNRHVITLLSCLGVPNEVFLKLQESEMKTFDMALQHPKAAENLFKSCHTHFGPFVKMLAKNIVALNDNTEPFIHALIQLVVHARKRELKKKCRMIVNGGATLLGIMDEYQQLKPGQIFAQVTKGERKGVITGKVIVYKCPCLHPGDILHLEAVDIPMFREKYHDVVIFPSAGTRPHPNETSGGDLDGDVFSVIWDTELIPPNNLTPMDYTAAKPNTCKHDITVSDITQFFVDYIDNDKLGVIANAWLACADRNGARSSESIQLAQLHSKAVDFPKSGMPVTHQEFRFLIPSSYPDFLEHATKTSYASEKILGLLYRKIDYDPSAEVQISYAEPLFDSFNEWQTEDDQQLYEHFYRKAKFHYGRYAAEISALMNRYHIKTEIELITASPLKHRAENTKWKQTRERVLESVKLAVDKYRSKFFEDIEHLQEAAPAASPTTQAPGEQQEVRSKDQLMMLSGLAWYNISHTYTNTTKRTRSRRSKKQKKQTGTPILSFVWIIGDVWTAIKSSYNPELRTFNTAKMFREFSKL